MGGPLQAEVLLLRSGIRAATERHLGHPINFTKWIDTMGGPKSGNDLLLERLKSALRCLHELTLLIPGAALQLTRNSVCIDVPGAPAMMVTFDAHQSRLSALASGVERELGVFANPDLLLRAVVWSIGAAAWGDRWIDPPAAPLSILPPADGRGYRLEDPDQSGGAWPEIAAEFDAITLSRACAHPIAHLITAATTLAVPDSVGLAERKTAAQVRHRDRVRGCLVGGAIGDALGYPVEFWSAERILASVGAAGVLHYLALPNRSLGVVSDDTQMTLFTADALARDSTRASDPPATRNALARAYLDWYDTQNGWENRPMREAATSALMSERWLYVRRAPGNTIMGALSQITDRTLSVPDAQNDSKGCGTVMRSAPFGLVLRWSPETVFAAAASAAAITHGHPVAHVAAGALALLVRLLAAGGDLELSVLAARDYAASQEGYRLTLTSESLDQALRLSHTASPTLATVESLGAGWIAEEALGIAVYCALAFPAAHQVMEALTLAVTHSGDSDSTGAICGNILGALHGESALPSALVAGVEGLATTRGVADALAEAR
ncbi:ADP-ribosylglycohydrolase family protein [Cryobacterium sp. TMT1-3]|nr:ADP-ribosylglycohydrolase family protein [Cryobacterium sp. TMT1-3]